MGSGIGMSGVLMKELHKSRDRYAEYTMLYPRTLSYHLHIAVYKRGNGWVFRLSPPFSKLWIGARKVAAAHGTVTILGHETSPVLLMKNGRSDMGFDIANNPLCSSLASQDIRNVPALTPEVAPTLPL